MAVTRLRVDELMYAWVAERDAPVQMGLLALFDAQPFQRPDGTVEVARVRGELAARAARVAALRRRVVWTRLGEGGPFWIDDPAFDPLDHIGAVTLPAGADLAGWAANRSIRLLDRDRPLWRAEIVTGLAESRLAVLLVLSHILADGLGAVTVAGALFDQRPDSVTPVIPTTAVAPLPSHVRMLRDRARSIGGALRLRRGTTVGGHRLGLHELRQFRAAMDEFVGPEPVTSLPSRIGPCRGLGVVREPLEPLQRTGHRLGVTVNDLLLAAVTGGLRQWLTARGENAPGLVLRATVPAAMGRAEHQVMNMLVVGLPVGEPDRLRRLALIHRATAEGKKRLRAAGGDVTDLRLPAPVVRWVMRGARRFGARRITLAVTDVPGPRAPLWLAGARLLSAVPIAPLSSGVALSVAALSYAGELAVSINADAAVTDLDVLTDGVAGTFAALHGLTPDDHVDHSLAVPRRQPPPAARAPRS